MTSPIIDDGNALPEPPSVIAKRQLPLVRKAAGTLYVRIHRAIDKAVWFGWDPLKKQFRPAVNRFDVSDRSYGVLNVAAGRDGAFAESVGRKPGTLRSNDELFALAITDLALTKQLYLVGLNGGGAVGALGATGVVGVGPSELGPPLSKSTLRASGSTGRHRVSVPA